MRQRPREGGQERKRGKRVALFGGTFDPVHSGHLAVARAALRRYDLDEVVFIPVSHPPHKRPDEMLPFIHRYAMVALACADDPRLIPSLAEATVNGKRHRIFYSVDTVRLFLDKLRRPRDRLYFLMGADSFLQIETWKKYRTLLTLCDFIVAHRPGFRKERLYEVIPPELLAPSPAGEKAAGGRDKQASIALRNTTVYLLDTVESSVSATHVRQKLERGEPVRGLVPNEVEEYIRKQALYGS